MWEIQLLFSSWQDFHMYTLQTFSGNIKFHNFDAYSVFYLKRPKLKNCFLYKHIEGIHMELFLGKIVVSKTCFILFKHAEHLKLLI